LLSALELCQDFRDCVEKRLAQANLIS